MIFFLLLLGAAILTHQEHGNNPLPSVRTNNGADVSDDDIGNWQAFLNHGGKALSLLSALGLANEDILSFRIFDECLDLIR